MKTKALQQYRAALSQKQAARLLNVAFRQRDAALEILGFDSYADYLASYLWHRIRRRIFGRAAGQCERCRNELPSQVHHWSYSVNTLLGKSPQHLEALCRSCHDWLHRYTAAEIGRLERRAKKESAVPLDMRPRLVKQS